MGRGLEQTFFQRKDNNSEQVCEKVLNIIIMETQIKTLMRYYLRPVKTAVTKTREDECWQGYRGKETLTCCWSERREVATAENSPEVPQKLKIEVPCGQAVPLLGVYPVKMKSLSCTLMLIAILFSVLEVWKQGPPPMAQCWGIRLLVQGTRPGRILQARAAQPTCQSCWALGHSSLSSETGEATAARSPLPASREECLLATTGENPGAAAKTQRGQT